MKTKLGLLLVMLSLAVWCDDSTDAEQPTDPKVVYKQPPSENQPESTVTDWTNRRFNRAVAATTKAQQRSDARSQWLLDNPKNPDPYKQRPATGEPEPKSAQAPQKSLPASLQQGLVAYYPFNGNAQDESGNENHGTVYEAALATDRHGNSDQGYLFDGVNDYIETQHPGPLDASPRTVSLWAQTISRDQQVILRWGEIAAGRDFRATLSYKVEGVSADIVNDAVTYSANVADGKWHHYCFVLHKDVNPTARDIRVFMDGTSLSNVIAKFPLDSIVNTSKKDPIYIGGKGSGSLFSGSLDDVRIYNRALSAAEVKSLYKYESKPPVKTRNNLLRKLAHFLRPQ